MTTIKIEIDISNAAFDPPQDEVARILRALADRVEYTGINIHPVIQDINGNRVGTYTVEGQTKRCVKCDADIIDPQLADHEPERCDNCADDADETTTICAYCDREVTAPASDSEPVPDVRDDEAWEALAAEHEPDCEWITTRAHRVFPAEGS